MSRWANSFREKVLRHPDRLGKRWGNLIDRIIVCPYRVSVELVLQPN
jgi:hypothetical protein